MHKVFTKNGVSVSVQSHSYERSGYTYQHNFLILRDLAKKVADTLQMESDDSNLSRLSIEDMSDSLKFKSLVLKVRTTGDSDMDLDEFFEYKDDSLRSLFSFTYLSEISRKDEYTLAGIINGMDEILYWGYEYPFTINLKNNCVKIDTSDIQVIKHHTTTLEPIRVYRVRGEQLSVPYHIKTGTTITIDTFFRKPGLVRMLLPDSTPVYIWKDDLFQKVETNTAG